jgi:hypothetical protein
MDAELTIRLAGPADGRRLLRLAGRDSRPRPSGEVLVAELDGDLVAARSLADGHAIADPFRPTAAIAELIAVRAGAQVGAGAAATQRRKRVGRQRDDWRGGLITEPAGSAS